MNAARVGEHGTRPLHELMQAALVSDELIAGAQVKMKSISQHQRGIDIFEMFGCERFSRGLLADRREDRREQVTVRCGEDAGAGAVVLSSDGKGKHIIDYNLTLGIIYLRGLPTIPFRKTDDKVAQSIRSRYIQ